MAGNLAHMDGAAQQAKVELEQAVRNMPDEQLLGVGVVLDWLNRHYLGAGYKRLLRIMRETIPPHVPPDVRVL
jgi:hypothetical protein